MNTRVATEIAKLEKMSVSQLAKRFEKLFGEQCRTLLKLDDGMGGVRMEWTDRDYLIRVEDLALGGSPAPPQRGDQIREVVGSEMLVYEVLAPGGEPPWRWADPHRQMYRIHTKQIA
jgi:hypothetical protein